MFWFVKNAEGETFIALCKFELPTYAFLSAAL